MPLDGGTPDFDLYRALEVDPEASVETIDAAFRSLIRRHHPDVAPDRAEALARTKQLIIARDWLTDPTLRAAYDRASRPRSTELRQAGSAARPPTHQRAPDTSSAAAGRAASPSGWSPGARDTPGDARSRSARRARWVWVVGLGLVLLAALPAFLGRPASGDSPPLAIASAEPSSTSPRPTPRPTVRQTPTPIPSATVAPTPSPKPSPTPSPSPMGIANLTLSGIYNETVRTTVGAYSCRVGHDLGSSRTYVQDVSASSPEGSAESWTFLVSQFDDQQYASLSFSSVDAYFDWFNGLDPGTIRNVQPSSLKIDIRMKDMRVRGTIQCPEE